MLTQRYVKENLKTLELKSSSCGVTMRLSPLFVFVLWNLMMPCPIDANGKLENSIAFVCMKNHRFT